MFFPTNGTTAELISRPGSSPPPIERPFVFACRFVDEGNGERGRKRRKTETEEETREREKEKWGAEALIGCGGAFSTATPIAPHQKRRDSYDEVMALAILPLGSLTFRSRR